MLAAMLGSSACPSEPEPGWQRVHDGLDGALLSVWGTSARDVWAVGADPRDGTGPLVLHFDGGGWTRIPTGHEGDLWWVFGFEDGPIYMGGDGGMILRQQSGDFTLMDSPGAQTVFGIWGASPDDLWAVGGETGAVGGFAWRGDGDTWTPEPSVPAEVEQTAAIWKVFGTDSDDVWLVGTQPTQGEYTTALHWNGQALEPAATGVGSSLFTVHERDGRYAAVGGYASGVVIENDGAGWHDVTPQPLPMGLSGVALGADETGIAVGVLGGVYTRDASGWSVTDLGFSMPQNLHATWIDDEGGLWAVGGQTLVEPLTEGILIHHGSPIPSEGL